MGERFQSFPAGGTLSDGERLEAWRRTARFTQTYLARLMGVTTLTQIGRYERDERVLSLPYLRAFCAALGITVVQFFGPIDERVLPAAIREDPHRKKPRRTRNAWERAASAARSKP